MDLGREEQISKLSRTNRLEAGTEGIKGVFDIHTREALPDAQDPCLGIGHGVAVAAAEDIREHEVPARFVDYLNITAVVGGKPADLSRARVLRATIRLIASSWLML